MPPKKLVEKFAEDACWLQAQPEMIPWEQGKEKLEQIFDPILERNHEEFFEQPVDRKHKDRPTYFQRLCRCLRYHWEKAQESQPNCRASDIAEEINQKYKTGNVFHDVILAVAVVLQEKKALWNVFRPLYEKTFQIVAGKKLTITFATKEVNHDELRETIFDLLVGLNSDESGRVKNARLDSYDGKGNFIRWLRKVIDRRIASYQKRYGTTEEMSLDLAGKSPSKEILKLRDIRLQLSPDERILLEYYYEHHLTLDEICVMNKSLHKQPTDKGNLSKKLKEIRDKIESRWDN